MLAGNHQDSRLLIGGAGLFLLTLLTSYFFNQWILLAVPVLILLGVLVILYPKLVYFSLFALIPFSTEIKLPGGGMFYNSLTIVLLTVFAWSIITTLFSAEPIISVKYLAAKLWYIVPFYFGTLIVYQRNVTGFRPLIKLAVATTVIATSYVLVRHAGLGFDFKLVNKAVRPIFRNHVTYGALLVLILPYLLYLWKTSKHPLKLAIYGALLMSQGRGCLYDGESPSVGRRDADGG